MTFINFKIGVLTFFSGPVVTSRLESEKEKQKERKIQEIKERELKKNINKRRKNGLRKKNKRTAPESSPSEDNNKKMKTQE